MNRTGIIASGWCASVHQLSYYVQAHVICVETAWWLNNTLSSSQQN